MGFKEYVYKNLFSWVWFISRHNWIYQNKRKNTRQYNALGFDSPFFDTTVYELKNIKVPYRNIYVFKSFQTYFNFFTNVLICTYNRHKYSASPAQQNRNKKEKIK